MSLEPTFAFMDESGTLHPNNPNRYFAVGAIIDSYPDSLIKDLHLILQHLESKLGRSNDPKLEFRFSSVTKTSLPIYKDLIDLLKRHQSWRFCCLIVDTEDSKYDQPSDSQEIWEEYLKLTKLLLKNNLSNQERTVLLADYYRQPSGEVHELATLPEVTPNLVDTLQVESQGILPVQIADVLLGASLYEGSDQVKEELSKEVEELRSSIASRRFDEWRIDWRK